MQLRRKSSPSAAGTYLGSTPKAVIFGPLPKTSTGKIQKFMLRNEIGSATAISA